MDMNLDAFDLAGLHMTDEQKAEAWRLHQHYAVISYGAISFAGALISLSYEADRAALNTVNLARALEKVKLSLPVPWTVAIWRWLILWAAVIALTWYGAM